MKLPQPIQNKEPTPKPQVSPESPIQKNIRLGQAYNLAMEEQKLVFQANVIKGDNTWKQWCDSMETTLPHRVRWHYKMLAALSNDMRDNPQDWENTK